MYRRLRRILVNLVARFAPSAVRPYALWSLGLKPLAGAEDPPEKKFTQEDVDRIVAERLARDRKDRPSDDQIKDWKEKAEQYDSVVAAGKTELEREKEAREAAEKERDDAKEAADKAATSAKESTRRTKIVEAALKAGAIDADEVHDLLAAKDFKVVKKGEDDKETELQVTIGDDGQVTGVEDVVKTFLGDKKHLVGESRRPDWDGGTRKPAPDEPDLAKLEDPVKVREAVAGLKR